MDDINWRKNLKRIREEADYKDQKKFSKACEVSQPVISLYESTTSKRRFTQRTLDKMLKTLKADYSDIFCDPNYCLTKEAMEKYSFLKAILISAHESAMRNDPVFLLDSLKTAFEYLKKMEDVSHAAKQKSSI